MDKLLGVIAYIGLGFYAIRLIAPGALKDGWLLDLSRYDGKALILAEAWEAIWLFVVALFSFYCWWFIFALYYTGPIARERRAEAWNSTL